MFGIVLTCTLICVAVGLVGQLFYRSDNSFGDILKWLVKSIIGNFLMNLVLIYWIMPAKTGPLAGLHYLWLPLLINVIVSGICWGVKDEVSPRSGECVGSAIALGILGIVLLSIAIGGNWGNKIAKSKANYLPVNMAEESAFPSTDPDHVVLVQDAAVQTIGSRALTEGGKNLGAIYQPGDYTLQSVDGHMYWVAPLIYKNFFANLSNYYSPGLIVVDAEDPDAQAILKMDHPLHFFPSAIFNQDLKRHVYLNGYSHYRLLDATMEIDDNWMPYFTLDASEYFAGLTGATVEKILVINSETGEIQVYGMEDKPAWIDRALPYDVIDQYVNWYGLWSSAPYWFWQNFQRANIEIPADEHPALAYSTMDASPVYQFVLSSENSTDHASTGVILADTNKLQATRYPIYGIAVGSQVDAAFSDTQENKVTQYPHSTPVLINVYGKLTWFTVYNSSADSGATFVGVGLMDAKRASANNVIMASTKEEALAVYHQWLTNHPSNTTGISQSSTELKATGTIVLIVPEVQNGTTYYYFYLSGDDVSNTVFSGIADLQTAELRFAKVGDTVSVTYSMADDGSASVSQFDDASIPPVGQ